ncbi:hypothetical protein GCM10023156_30380 [Novipirellula rosea]|uniref:Uncharacterized protein n=1 Tax=Novipirellula rosea TaxID=1031540 RepID=A0ABP8MTF3_9BACT
MTTLIFARVPHGDANFRALDLEAGNPLDASAEKPWSDTLRITKYPNSRGKGARVKKKLAMDQSIGSSKSSRWLADVPPDQDGSRANGVPVA